MCISFGMGFTNLIYYFIIDNTYAPMKTENNAIDLHELIST
jgi:hypothetical protein